MKIEKYEDLVHGMYVTCEIDGEKIEDARLSINEDGDVYICQNKKDGAPTKKLFGYTYSWWMASKNDNSATWGKVTNLCSVEEKTEEKTLDNLKKGDVLVNDKGETLTILGTAYRTTESHFSAEELEEYGYKIQTTPTLTKAEAEKKLGVKIID